MSNQDSLMETVKKLKNHPEKIQTAIGIILLFATGWLYISCIEPHILGLLFDDTIYVTLSKSLVSGQGYKALYMVTQPTQTLYPFLYPLTLSAGWLIWPDFPGNIDKFMGITVAFSLASLTLFYHYLRYYKKLPFGLTCLILIFLASNSFYLYYSIMTMTEIPYLFFSILTLYYAEKKLEKITLKSLVITILFSALSFHTRVVGVALIGGIFIWLLLRKQWKYAFIYGFGTAFLTVIPWIAWTSLHRPPAVTELNYPLVYEYGSYASAFLLNLFSDQFFLSSLINNGVAGFFHSIKLYFLPIGGLWATWVVGIIFGLFAITQGVQSIRRKEYSPSALYLTLYIGAIILWRYDDQMHRFIVVILPWLWYYALKPFASIAWGSPFKKRILIICFSLFLCFEGLILTSGFLTFKTLKDHLMDSTGARKWSEYEATFNYLKTKTPSESVVGTHWGPLFYLYTHRVTFNTSYWSLKREHGKRLYTPEAIKLLYKSVRHYGVNYMVLEFDSEGYKTRNGFPPVPQRIIEAFPESFSLVYHSPKNQIHVYRVAQEKNPGKQ